MMNETDYRLLTSKLDFWSQLTDKQSQLLLSSTISASFKAGTTLHYNDIDCIGLLYIKTGILRIYMTSKEGREITLYRLEAGNVCILSAACMLQNIDFDVSVDAESDCEILQVNTSAFSKVTSENIYVELFSYSIPAPLQSVDAL